MNAAQINCQQSAQYRKRHRQDNHERQRPFFILGGQNQEDHDQTKNKGLGRCAAGQLFLIGGTDPRQRIVVAQNLTGHFLHRRNRLTGRITVARIAQHLGGRENVKAVNQLRSGNALDFQQSRQRYQLPAVGFDINVTQVVRSAAEASFRLQNHPEIAAFVSKVINIKTAEG